MKKAIVFALSTAALIVSMAATAIPSNDGGPHVLKNDKIGYCVVYIAGIPYRIWCG